jgi:two-component system chemotaxis sensor kinase CheA
MHATAFTLRRARATFTLQEGVDCTAGPQTLTVGGLAGQAPRFLPAAARDLTHAAAGLSSSQRIAVTKAGPVHCLVSLTPSNPTPTDSSGSPPLERSTELPGRFVPIGLKFALVSMLVVGIATAVAFFQATHRERDRLIDAKRIAASMVADLLAQSLQAPLDFNDEDALRNELDHLKQNEEVAYAAVWRKGEAEPWLDLRARGAQLPLPADHDTPGTTSFEDRVETVRSIVGRANKPLGSVLIQFSLARDNADLAMGRRDILFYCLALALGTTALLIGVTRRQIVTPLETLLGAARSIERGERGARVNVRANDEIGRLAGAFNAMNAAIFDREQRLATANKSLRELFDHMAQGIVVFGPDGKVEGTHSRAAGDIFGDEKLAGRDARELLYGGAAHWDAERRAFEEWLPLGFEATSEHWPAVVSLAPQALTLNAGTPEQRDLALEFRPIAQQGKVSKIMLLATDQSEQRRLEREMERQDARHKSQIALMRRLVAGGGQQFVAFLQRARRRFDRAAELLPAHADRLDLATIGEVFQIAHTLRAEAMTFELSEIGQVLHKLEEHLSELREEARLTGAAAVARLSAELRGSLEFARELIEESEELFAEASPAGRAALETLAVQKRDVAALLELSRGRNDEIEAVALRLASRPFGECVASLLEQASAWAERQNKRVRFEVEGRETPVPPALADVLGGVLAHLVRNAIAHGIEPVPERMSLGKPAVGSIELSCRPDGANGAVLVVDDDGRGIAHNPFFAAASQGELPLQNLRDVAITTAPEPSELAGRGVGLSAVEEDLARVGYAVSVAMRDGGGTRFEIRPRAAGRA